MKKCLTIPSFIVFALVFSALFFTSCSKDEVTNISSTNEASAMLSFKGIKEFQEALTKVYSLSTQERKVYEESMGYRSFGRTCDELYSNLDPEEFKSVEEIKVFVNANSEYFQLVEDNNGELTVEKTLLNNPFRYFLNRERMFKIDKTVYRIFDDETVMTNEQNTDKLRNLDKRSIALFKNDPDFKFLSSKLTDVSSQLKVTKDYPPPPYVFCGPEYYGVATDGRDRTKLWLGWIRSDDPYYSYFHTQLNIVPYKKTLGVWFICSRTISWNVRYASDFYVNGTWTRKVHYPPTSSGIFDNSAGFLVFEETTAGNATVDYHFGGYDGWGRTPSAPIIYLSCNPNSF